MQKTYYVYIMTNFWKTTLYIGVTNNLVRRVQQHKSRLHEGFTKKYNLTYLVYYEATNDISGAIYREKQLKRWKREWKENLIIGFNPQWRDLSDQIMG